MKRPVPRRLPLSFLPLLLLIWGIVIWGMVQFGLLPSDFLTGRSRDDVAHEQLAISLKAIQRGDTQSAIAAMARASRVLSGPNLPPSAAYATVGSVMTRNGQGTTAAQFLQEAVREPDIGWDPQVWTALVDANESANNTSAAAEARAEADRRAEVILATIGKASVDSEDTAIRLWEAGQYYAGAKRDTARALKALNEAARLLPENPYILNSLGYILADRGQTPDDMDRAKVLTRRALQLVRDEDLPAIRATYGWALYKRGDVAGARRVLRETIDDLNGSPLLHYHLGVVYEALGQPADAREEIKRALQIDPHFENAPDAQKRLKDLSAYP